MQLYNILSKNGVLSQEEPETFHFALLGFLEQNCILLNAIV